MWRSGSVCGIVGLLLGCTLDTTGVSSPMVESLGHDETDDPTAPTTTLGDSDDGSADTTGDPDPGELTTGGSDGGPRLVITEGPSFDFGTIDTGMALTHAFTVTNLGSVTATGLSAAPLPAPYALTGPFPGAGGTCGSALGPAEACTVEVELAPTELGLHLATLAVTQDAGPEASCALRGGGLGRSDNLLTNPGGEMLGSPPPGWDDVGAGTWLAGDPFMGVPPIPQGLAYLGSTNGPDGQDYVLRQDVPVDPWVTTIDEGVLRASFEGSACNYLLDNDRYRMRVLYLDEADAVLATWDTDWATTDAWVQHAEERLAPAGTRTVRVELLCRKDTGEFCDAFYDELQLRVLYP